MIEIKSDNRKSPLRVTTATLQAYENQSGLYGMGEILLKKGLVVLEDQSN